MYKILSRNGDTEFFNTYKELLLFLKNETHVLKNACHNFNDKMIEVDYYYDYFWNVKYKFREYIFIDPYDRILSVPKLKYDCDHIKPEPRHKVYYHRQIEANIARKKSWDFRQSRNPKPYRKYYRRIKTQQERKWNSSVDHKPYVRPKRRPHYLDPWDIEKFPSDKGYGWKQFKKVRKQWLC